MDEQRIREYVNLLNELLQCEQGEEGRILRENRGLVDEGLLQVGMSAAQELMENGQEQVARWLVRLLEQVFGGESREQRHTPEDYRQFIVQLMQAEQTGNSQQTQALLASHQHLLDGAFAGIFQMLVNQVIEEYPEEENPMVGLVENISLQISNFPLGDLQTNKEIAIAGYQWVLQRREDNPELWAQTQNNLGTAYGDLATIQEKGENLEKAISAFQNALKFYTLDKLPQYYAATQNNLGAAYRNLATIREKGENLDRAIAAFQNALKFRTHNKFPQDYAMTQNNLGNAYQELASIREKGENLDRAIAAFQNALKFRTPDKFPQKYATTQNNLGVAYQKLATIREKGENLDRAISAYYNALKFHTPDKFPQYYAATQNNLGAAYQELATICNKEENLERAIIAYEKSLEVYQKEKFPQGYATTQNNLGTAYQELATIYKKEENLDRAIQAYRQALTVYLPQTLPLTCFTVAKSLGNLGFKEGDWNLAIEGYATAIEAVEQSRAWTTTDDRRQELMANSMGVYDNIIQAYVNLEQYDQALEYADRSRSKHLVDLMHSNDLYQGGEIPEAVQALLQRYEALQTAINQKRQPPQNSSDNKTVATTRQTFETFVQDIEALEAEKQQVWQALRRQDPVLAGSKEVAPLSFTEMQKLLPDATTALLSFYTTRDDIFIFILYKDKPTQCHRCFLGYALYLLAISKLLNDQYLRLLSVYFHALIQQRRLENLQAWLIENWTRPYANYIYKDNPQWRDNMVELLHQLTDRLNLNHLIQTHLQGIEELIIVPHLVLHQIPFAALPLSAPTPHPHPQALPEESRKPGGTPKTPKRKQTATRYLGDEFRIRLIPSCRILQYCQERPPLKEPALGIVADATEDLPFTPFECQTIAQAHKVPASRYLRGKQATVDQYKTLLQTVGRLHSSHHAAYDWQNPLNSKLLLADGDLTLGLLLTPGWRMPDVEEIFTSCCEVNFTAANPSDDPLTLAAGFLCAGARAVITTQWAVADLGSALLAILYDQKRNSGVSRSTALQQAQQKLRSLTGKELKQRYERQLSDYLQERYSQDETRLSRLKDGLSQSYALDTPFDDPYYWAGFVVQGMN
ncbi:CHAT domain-containing protein [Roseofilum capinflatum]|uniref:CHAT domain-containing protein n=1 Tax=Roseofilum capinflatum BLCC-M114 TaxID=3022440 RepID=A0ABT7B8W4_9CYAN|nr:CHAT domain-containing protein [Roseofilum capinflatum]MDJ1175618.1 CHAT domain-containing protein [Roseofilum capinflatum BLCC-M114]